MKVTKPSEKEVTRFFEARIAKDAISKTLDKAKSLHLTESECQPIIFKRFQLEKDFFDLKQDLIAKSIINSNLIDFQNGWYGIIAQNKDKTELLVSPLTNINVDDFICDFNVGTVKSKQEYSNLMVGKIDSNALADYKTLVFRKQDEFLKEFFNCENKIIKNDEEFLLTSHCIRRWKERIVKNSDSMTMDLRKQFVEEISQSFKNAKFTYLGSGGDKYFLDEDNMAFFVVTVDNVIATLWRNTYQFPTMEIDKVCTLMILSHLQKKKAEFEEFQKQENEKIDSLCVTIQNQQEEIDDIDRQISDLWAKKSDCVKKQEELKQQIKEYQDGINNVRNDLRKEESLLFKPHKVVLDE